MNADAYVGFREQIITATWRDLEPLVDDMTDALVEMLPGGGGEATDFYSGYRDVNLRVTLDRLANERFADWLRVADDGLPAPGSR